ncbi:hypothetical protein [Deinococcus irradiatisoli]|nr:hypothetical protein [Deinococcus irradiatisoli]
MDYQQAFRNSFTPMAMQQLAEIIDEAAAWSGVTCTDEFPAGNFAGTQGSMRRQRIEDRMRTTRFDGQLIAQTMDFGGNLLVGDERISNFTLLRFGEVGLIVCRSSNSHPVPRRSKMRCALAAGESRQDPLFPEELRRIDLKVGNLKMLFVVRYWLDGEDTSYQTVGDIEVVVLDEDATRVNFDLYDLRFYAAGAMKTMEPDVLPMALKDDAFTEDRAQLPGERAQDPNLPISFKKPEGE